MKKLSPYLIVFALLIAGCDAAGPDETEIPEPVFEATFSGPVDAQIQGRAALAGPGDFEEQTFFTFPLPHLSAAAPRQDVHGDPARGPR